MNGRPHLRQPAEEPNQPGRDDLQLLLTLSAATLRTAREQRRRVAALLLGVALVCGVLALLCAVLWLATDRRADAIEDRPLVRIDALNIEIPDPRPELERGALRLRALVYALAGAAFAGFGTLAAVVWAVIRPSRLPPDLAAAISYLSSREPPVGRGTA